MAEWPSHSNCLQVISTPLVNVCAECSSLGDTTCRCQLGGTELVLLLASWFPVKKDVKVTVSLSAVPTTIGHQVSSADAIYGGR